MKEFNVAVTGNAPFLEYDFNTSAMVRDALPDVIRRPGKVEIRIQKYARDTRDTYKEVRQVSKEIWDGQRSLFLPELQPGEKDEKIDIDLILHMGMVALGYPQKFYFETLARRDGYVLPGADGRIVDSKELEKLGLPEILYTSADVESAWRKVKDESPDVPSCVSRDAALHYCEFRMYSSLAELWLNDSYRDKRGRVVFQHVPQAHETKDIALARDVAVAFITGVVDAYTARRDVAST